ncbi:MAG: hypothetical protein B6I35_11905 [Anaerolineaceae bacterium 4572_32.2]|nr:MAG: hypothetical protein B6I35_11905 [Anaerolineaceae bacterium 4572_32.2]
MVRAATDRYFAHAPAAVVILDVAVLASKIIHSPSNLDVLAAIGDDLVQLARAEPVYGLYSVGALALAQRRGR